MLTRQTMQSEMTRKEGNSTAGTNVLTVVRPSVLVSSCSPKKERASFTNLQASPSFQRLMVSQNRFLLIQILKINKKEKLQQITNIVMEVSFRNHFVQIWIDKRLIKNRAIPYLDNLTSLQQSCLDTLFNNDTFYFKGGWHCLLVMLTQHLMLVVTKTLNALLRIFYNVMR